MTKSLTATAVKLPKFDIDALIAFQKANLDTVVAAQRVLFDLAQTVTRRQFELVRDLLAQADAALKGFDARKEPQAYVDEAKAVVEKAMADVKETLDLGMRAQAEVVDLFVKRATANLDEVKTLAA